MAVSRATFRAWRRALNAVAFALIVAGVVAAAIGLNGGPPT